MWPTRSVDYYERVETGDAQVRGYFRMFLIPGVQHCGGGVGPDRADWPAVIVEWIENGVPPAKVVAEKRDEEGQIAMGRPLCPYPQRAVYDGVGDPGRGGQLHMPVI